MWHKSASYKWSPVGASDHTWYQWLFVIWCRVGTLASLQSDGCDFLPASGYQSLQPVQVSCSCFASMMPMKPVSPLRFWFTKSKGNWLAHAFRPDKPVGLFYTNPVNRESQLLHLESGDRLLTVQSDRSAWPMHCLLSQILCPPTCFIHNERFISFNMKSKLEKRKIRAGNAQLLSVLYVQKHRRTNLLNIRNCFSIVKGRSIAVGAFHLQA